MKITTASVNGTLNVEIQHCIQGLYTIIKEGDGEYVHTGDSVGVVMNTAKGELSFIVNGVNIGVAFDGILLDKLLVPCVFNCLVTFQILQSTNKFFFKFKVFVVVYINLLFAYCSNIGSLILL